MSEDIKRFRTPPVIGSKGTRWGHPIVVFSNWKIDNKLVPKNDFTNQALHCDFQPDVAKAKAGCRGGQVPYSIIINSSPEDAMLVGCGLASLEVTSVKNGKKPYSDFREPVLIPIPTGCIMLFRGDYVHGGASYAHNHTRLFMGLHLNADNIVVNTICLEEDAKLAPLDIKGEPISRDNNRDTGTTSSRKRVSEGKSHSKKRKASK